MEDECEFYRFQLSEFLLYRGGLQAPGLVSIPHWKVRLDSIEGFRDLVWVDAVRQLFGGPHSILEVRRASCYFEGLAYPPFFQIHFFLEREMVRRLISRFHHGSWCLRVAYPKYPPFELVSTLSVVELSFFRVFPLGVKG